MGLEIDAGVEKTMSGKGGSVLNYSKCLSHRSSQNVLFFQYLESKAGERTAILVTLSGNEPLGPDHITLILHVVQTCVNVSSVQILPKGIIIVFGAKRRHKAG